MDSLHKLGKKPATYDKRDLQFAHYRTAAPLPPHPKQFGHEKLVAANGWQMLGNGPDNTVSPGFQGAGDCVFAGGDHETMLWTLEAGSAANFSGATAISDYSAVTGYNPKDPNSDQGTDVREALKYRQNTGLIDAAGSRHQIGAISHWSRAMWTILWRRSISSESWASASSFPVLPWINSTQGSHGASCRVHKSKVAITFRSSPSAPISNALPGDGFSK
jgi:hypothetical protein